MSTFKSILMGLAGACVIFLAGCTPQSIHPNQINTFDGATFDSLTVAHAALVSLRGTVSTQYPRYSGVFNQAAASYAVAYNGYATYRSTTANQAAVALALSNLTVSIVALENTIQSDMHVPPSTVSHVRGRASRLRAAAQPRITISDVLTELEIAATIAASVPGTEPYSTLAAVVIRATQQAVAALSASSGRPIDLSVITPVMAI